MKKIIDLTAVVALLPASAQPKAKAIAVTLFSAVGVLAMFEKWSWLAVATSVLAPVAVHQTPNLDESKGSA